MVFCALAEESWLASVAPSDAPREALALIHMNNARGRTLSSRCDARDASRRAMIRALMPVPAEAPIVLPNKVGPNRPEEPFKLLTSWVLSAPPRLAPRATPTPAPVHSALQEFVEL